MSDGKTVGARLSEPLDEEFDEFVEENGMSNSEALRTLVRDGLEAQVEDQSANSVALTTQILATMLAIFFTTAGYGLAISSVGIAFGSVAGLLVIGAMLLTGVDTRLSKLLDWFRGVFQTTGGVIGFAETVWRQESKGPENPETPVEYIATLDIVGGFLVALGALLILPIWVAMELVGTTTLFALLPSATVLDILFSGIVLTVFAFVFLALSEFAALAIATARLWKRTDGFKLPAENGDDL